METLKTVTDDFKSIINKPESYLCLQDARAKKSNSVLKSLYDFLKAAEKTLSWVPNGTLPELIVDNFDEEQIWQEVELQNEGLCSKLVEDVASLLAKRDRLSINTGSSDEDDSNDDAEASSVDEGSEIADSEEEYEQSDDEPKQLKFQFELDDNFFKLSEMETFCEEMEKEEKQLGVNLFADHGENETEPELIRYNDFFSKSKKTKTVKAKDLEEGEDSDGDGAEIEEGLDEENVSEDEKAEEEGPICLQELRSHHSRNQRILLTLWHSPHNSRSTPEMAREVACST